MRAFNLKLFLLVVLVNVIAINAYAAQNIVSLDMCSDQYALALLPPNDIGALSQRSMHEDSYYRSRAKGIVRHRPSLEVILALKPKAVLRTWGGDARLLEALKTRGVKVIQIEDVADFAGARSELLRVGAHLGRADRAQSQARQMDAAVTSISRQGRGRKVLYYTPSGYTAGPKTWVGEVLEKMNFTVMSQQDYYSFLSPEAFLNLNPDVYALGFYGDKYAMRRVAGRHPLVRRKIAEHESIELPGPAIACNAWYSPMAIKAGLRG